QFANDRPEDTGTDRFTLVVQDDSGVLVEANERAVITTDRERGANDDSLTDITLLNTSTGDCFLDRHHNDVAHGCIAAMRAAQNLDALNPASAGVISNIQISLHLDHSVTPDLRGQNTLGVSLNGWFRRRLP